MFLILHPIAQLRVETLTVEAVSEQLHCPRRLAMLMGERKSRAWVTWLKRLTNMQQWTMQFNTFITTARYCLQVIKGDRFDTGVYVGIYVYMLLTAWELLMGCSVWPRFHCDVRVYCSGMGRVYINDLSEFNAALLFTKCATALETYVHLIE